MARGQATQGRRRGGGAPGPLGASRGLPGPEVPAVVCGRSCTCRGRRGGCRRTGTGNCCTTGTCPRRRRAATTRCRTRCGRCSGRRDWGGSGRRRVREAPDSGGAGGQADRLGGLEPRGRRGVRPAAPGAGPAGRGRAGAAGHRPGRGRRGRRGRGAADQRHRTGRRDGGPRLPLAAAGGVVLQGFQVRPGARRPGAEGVPPGQPRRERADDAGLRRPVAPPPRRPVAPSPCWRRCPWTCGPGHARPKATIRMVCPYFRGRAPQRELARHTDAVRPNAPGPGGTRHKRDRNPEHY